MKVSKQEGASLNQQDELLELLKKKAPEIFTEGKIDSKQLKATLGEDVLTDAERYGLSWSGKMDCFRMIQETTTNTLKPVRDESVDFDDTENLFIEGDNLQVLKTLQKSYYGKVKMIYIDPPYNTGNDFIYNDKFSQNKREYLEEIGAIDVDGNVLNASLYKQNTKDSGHYHSTWLNMMYPRLFLARNLLRQDGVIFVSIDDNEVHNLRLVMNEIFGEENFVNMFIWKKNSSGKTVSKEFPTNVEYVLMFARSVDDLQFNVVYKPLAESTKKMYSKDDGDDRGKYRLYPLQKTGNPGPETTYEYVDNTGKVWKCPAKGWRMVQRKIKALENDNRLVLTGDTLNEKAYWNERANEGQAADTLWDDISEGNIGTSEVKKIFDEVLFDYPKPTELLRRVVKVGCSNSDVVLDFFAGSATTAHAVMQLNAEDGGNRKWICVQLPEVCKEGTEAAKAGYKTIADIAKERIRRAGKNIKVEHPDSEFDSGFKVFKLGESNFKIWNTQIESAEQFEQQMLGMFDVVREGSTTEAMLYELILKSGKELNIPISGIGSDTDKTFKVNDGSLVICFTEKMNEELFKKMLIEKPKKIVMLDSAFENNDQLKTNLLLQAEGAGVDEVRVL